MDIRFRLPQEHDAESCAALVMDNQPFSEDMRFRFPGLLAKLLKDEAIQAVVYENRMPAGPRVVGFAATGFAAPQWIDHELSSPAPGLVERLYRAEAEEQPQLLRPKQIAVHNAGFGLDLVFMHHATRRSQTEDEIASTVQRLNTQSFLLALAGFFCRRMVHEVWEPCSLSALSALGFRPPHADTEVALSPVLVLDATSVAAVPFHPFAFLFSKQLGRLDFTPAQQHQLKLALWYLSDEQIAAEMAVSVNTVRKRWDDIFERAAKGDPELFGPQQERTVRTRGPDRRRALLSYLNMHLEELGPLAIRGHG